MKRIKHCAQLLVILSVFALTACRASESPKVSETEEDATSMTDTSSEIETSMYDNTEKQQIMTPGTEEYRGFQMDNVLHSDSLGEIHYHIYVPDSYDGSEPYALYVTLPGYEGLYFQGVGVNLRSENFAFEAQKYNDKMIIAAPQLDDWGETSANKTVELVRFLIEYYNIDTSMVYANGYSGGGETMSLVLEKAPELFTAYLHCSSKWDGDYMPVVENRVPIYFVIGEDDEYYGSEPTKKAYQELHDLYEAEGLSEEEIDRLLVLDIKEREYFSSKGIDIEHGGGGLFAQDEDIMGWLFSQKKINEVLSDAGTLYTAETKIKDVINDPVFGDYGRLIFPVETSYYSGDTLGSLRLTWYNNIDPDTTVEIVNYMRTEAAQGNKIFYDIYTDDEKKADPDKENTGIFFFKGNPGEKFAVCNAGGAFAYVGAMQDSFPHALELSKKGYNAFALIYRPGAQTACEDLSRAIAFIFEHADELEVDTADYSLWGGSAGARMAAWVGRYGTDAFGESELPQPAAVIMQYTGLNDYSEADPPTFVTVGENDMIADWRVMKQRLEAMSRIGIPTEFHSYPGLGHGFGIGKGTVAEGWLDEAVEFWESCFSR